MKRVVAFFLAFIMLFAGCGNQKELEKQIEELNKKVETLKELNIELVTELEKTKMESIDKVVVENNPFPKGMCGVRSKASTEKDYWTKSEVIISNSIELNTPIKSGRAKLDVYVMNDEPIDGTYTFELCFETRSGDWLNYNKNVDSSDIDGSIIPVSLEYNLQNSTTSFILQLKIHHNGTSKNNIIVGNYEIHEYSGKKYRMDDFKQMSFTTSELVGNGTGSQSFNTLTSMPNGFDPILFNTTESTLVAESIKATLTSSGCERIKFSIGGANSEDWWYESETNLIAEVEKPEALTNGLITMRLHFPDEESYKGSYGFELSINEDNFSAPFFIKKEMHGSELKKSPDITLHIPYDEEINERDNIKLLLKTHHKGESNLPIEVTEIRLDDANGISVNFDQEGMDISALDFNYLNRSSQNKPYAILNKDGKVINLVSSRKDRTGIAIKSNRKESVEDFDVTVIDDNFGDLGSGYCEIGFFIPDDGKNKVCNFGLSVYGRNAQGKEILLTRNDIKGTPNEIKNDENYVAISAEEGIYVYSRSAILTDENVSDKLRLHFVVEENKSNLSIADITIKDEQKGLISLNLADTGEFKDIDTGEVSEAIAVEKIGRSIYLADFKDEIYTFDKIKVTPASDIYEDLKPLYEISDTSIATIDSDGKINPKMAGTVKLKVINDLNGEEAEYLLKIYEPYLKITNIRWNIGVNDTENFAVKAIGYPGGNYTWESSDSNVISVDDNGKVVGRSEGTAEIRVVDKDSGYSGSEKIKCMDFGKVDVSKYITFIDHPDIDSKNAAKVEELLFRVYQPVFDFFNYGEFRHVTVKYDHINMAGVAAYATSIQGEQCITVGIDGIKNEDYDVLTHELIHTAQNYKFVTAYGEDVTWLGEGLTDYGRYLFGIWNEQSNWRLPSYNPSQHYTDSYGVTAAFIKFVVDNYDADFARELNDAFKQEKYTHDLWKEATGYTIDELWELYSKK